MNILYGLVAIWLFSIAGLFLIFRIDKDIQGGYISGTEVFWLIALFAPLLNTLFCLVLWISFFLKLFKKNIDIEDTTDDNHTGSKKSLFEGVVEDIDNEVAYVRLWENVTEEESQAEIFLKHFPHIPERGYMFHIYSDATIGFMEKNNDA